MSNKKVAIQGYEGCFHQIVANNYFGNNTEILPCATFRDVANNVLNGDVEYGIMAIENSIAGTILPNLSILQNNPLQIAGEYYLRIKQNLMVMPGVTLEDIEEVHSHPMALLQCIDFLDSHRWKLVETDDTALSAKHIAEKGLRNVAAIAGTLAAEIYGLEVIAPDINTIRNNYTRFLILQKEGLKIYAQSNKASLCFKTDHKQGSLLNVMMQMQQSSINLTKLQSSPIPDEPWHYMFHVDMEFDNVKDFHKVIDNMRQYSEELCVYGIYKSGLNL